MPCSGERTTSMARRKGSCIREMQQMQFLLLVTEPRAGRANGTRIRWEDVDDGSDGGCSATARPHGKQNTGRANEDERNLKLCLTLVEFAKWRAVVGCHSSATAHLLIAAIHSHRVLSWQAFAFGVFSRARCGEETPPLPLRSLGRSEPTSDLNRSAAASVLVHCGLAICEPATTVCHSAAPSWHAGSPERQLCLAAELNRRQDASDASPAAACDVL